MKAAFPPTLLSLLLLAIGLCGCKPQETTSTGPKSVNSGLTASSTPRRLSTARSESVPWQYRFSAIEENHIEESADLQAILHFFLNPSDSANPAAILNRLSAEDLRLLLLKVAAPPSDFGEDRVLLIVRCLGGAYPAECVQFLDEVAPHLGERQILSQAALGEIAKTRPALAEDWLNLHAYLFIAEDLTATESFVVGGIATHEPLLAFQAADRWMLSQDNATVRAVLQKPETLEEKAIALDALRTRITEAANPEAVSTLQKQGFSGLGAGLSTNYESCDIDLRERPFRFAEVIAFLEKMNLNAEERESFANGFGGPDDLAEFEPWIQWFRENTSGTQVRYLEDLQRQSDR